MNIRSIVFVSIGALALPAARAGSPAELLDSYRQSGGGEPSAQRGAQFYVRKFGVSAKLPSCASCHADSPLRPGRHVVTDKAIKPLSPAANAERFSDLAKAEKWFRRNCTEVVGRECSAVEKADFIAFVMGGR